MVLFIVIAIGILIYTIFAKDYLVDCIKGMKEYNKKIEENIRYGRTNYDVFFSRTYDKRDYTNIFKIFIDWILINVFFNVINFIVVFIISIVVVWICPQTNTEYSFNINSLKDSVVTSGEIHGGAFCVSGSIDGEISYFFSRTMNEGEKIGHIPANKSYIRYDNEGNPHIEVYQKVNEIPKWVSKMFWTDWVNEPITDYYVIVVPEGTISTTETYEIDME